MASTAVAPSPDSVAQVAESVKSSTKVVEIVSTTNAILAQDKYTSKYVLITVNQEIALEASTLIELLVDVANERSNGVLDLQDEELEILFGTAFLVVHDALQFSHIM